MFCMNTNACNCNELVFILHGLNLIRIVSLKCIILYTFQPNGHANNCVRLQSNIQENNAISRQDELNTLYQDIVIIILWFGG